ncbi:hypothetical protein B0H16DRAFT_775211 [Mycena metata]|uniref:Uncharacterized protein n=1 Tax=Mycena metata TaxID=1033252 RepID=A0AAD7IYK3_9AGAR|nr:hypothetical protein B0H16DRAFT_775211 [Mycena metata]
MPYYYRCLSGVYRRLSGLGETSPVYIDQIDTDRHWAFSRCMPRSCAASPSLPPLLGARRIDVDPAQATSFKLHRTRPLIAVALLRAKRTWTHPTSCRRLPISPLPETPSRSSHLSTFVGVGRSLHCARGLLRGEGMLMRMRGTADSFRLVPVPTRGRYLYSLPLHPTPTSTVAISVGMTMIVDNRDQSIYRGVGDRCGGAGAGTGMGSA